MQAWPSYDRAPPLGLPLPFLLAAPCWLLLTGLCLRAAGEGALDRFDPAALAATHALALGVLGNAMCGALLQILAVVAGMHYPRAAIWRTLGFWGLQIGAAALAGSFLAGFPPFGLILAGGLLGSMLLAFAACGLYGIARSVARDASTQGAALALSALLLAVLLALLLLGVLARGWALPWKILLDAHAIFAAGGWLLGLIMAVAATVVPMFQITPAYPAGWLRLGGKAWLAALAIAVACLANDLPVWGLIGPIAIALVFAGLTLSLLRKSRRPQDAGRRFWLGAMICLAGALLLAMAGACGLDRPGLAAACGWLMLFGLGCGAVLGMWCKILPFLFWLDLQKRAPSGCRAPSTLQLLPDSAPRRLFWAYAATVSMGMPAILGLAPLWMAAAALSVLSLLWLACALGSVLRYRTCLRELNARAAGQPASRP
ncbi:hypothetical protein [Chromobacterium sp. IIBBL 290-4]|uniref:hypothetical protein n=1 Tax=Chromobacterium sp. IIBBL 290-4 TaxID=2953890 RepID=UPI0020B76637|nr:hypothetical protein [Chromobacterium sp. IIBBL 290-4]UTH73766.1 hypothetical protein NKT35_19820 [Chromobacterium sp. IIBBL 290-4]